MYFSGFCIWNGVSQLLGVKRIFFFSMICYNAQFYNKTANIAIFLLFSRALYYSRT